MPILASYSDYVTVTCIVFLYTCSLSLAAVAFLAFSAGVSVHIDRSPSSVCVERNFLGPNPVASINYTLRFLKLSILLGVLQNFWVIPIMNHYRGS